MNEAAFYVRDGVSARYHATSATIGPWDAKLQHGGPVAALLASRIERAAGVSGAARIAQFSLDFLSPVPVATLEVQTTLVRPGKKIALWAARALVGEREVVRVNAWVLSTAPERSPEVRLSDATPRALSVPAATSYFATVPHFPYGDALEWRFIEGGFAELGSATVWTRLRVAIVADEPVTPLARLLAMVDSANGVSAELDVSSHLFVPVNLNVTLARHPSTDWVGMRADTAIASDGVGVTRAHLFDEQGALGEALQALFVERR